MMDDEGVLDENVGEMVANGWRNRGGGEAEDKTNERPKKRG